MIDWKYDPKNYESESYVVIPAGDYRVRIEEAKEQVSQSGKEMIRLKLKVNGYNIPLWSYLVFDSSSEKMRKRTDQRLGSIYESFGIERGNLNVEDWAGKTGGARVKNRADKDGEMRAEVHYFLNRKKVNGLPAWEGETSKESESETYGNFDFGTYDTTASESSSEIPF